MFIHAYSFLIVVRRMEQQVKVVLNEISEDPIRLGILLTGKRVQLAEDLSKLICVIFCCFSADKIIVLSLQLTEMLNFHILFITRKQLI